MQWKEKFEILLPTKFGDYLLNWKLIGGDLPLKISSTAS